MFEPPDDRTTAPPKTFWSNKTPFQTALILILCIAIPFFIIMLIVYIVSLTACRNSGNCNNLCYDLFEAAVRGSGLGSGHYYCDHKPLTNYPRSETLAADKPTSRTNTGTKTPTNTPVTTSKTTKKTEKTQPTLSGRLIEIPKDDYYEMSEDHNNNMPEDNHDNMPEDHNNDMPEDNHNDMPEDHNNDMPEDNHDNMPEDDYNEPLITRKKRENDWPIAALVKYFYKDDNDQQLKCAVGVVSSDLVITIEDCVDFADISRSFVRVNSIYWSKEGQLKKIEHFFRFGKLVLLQLENHNTNGTMPKIINNFTKIKTSGKIFFWDGNINRPLGQTTKNGKLQYVLISNKTTSSSNCFGDFGAPIIDNFQNLLGFQTSTPCGKNPKFSYLKLDQYFTWLQKTIKTVV